MHKLIWAWILWSFVAIVFLSLSYFIYLNRGHSKIQEAIIVFIAISLASVLSIVCFSGANEDIGKAIIASIGGLIAVVLSIVLISSDNDVVTKDISIVQFVSLDKNEPVFFTAPVLLQYLMPSGIIWGNYARQNPETTKLAGFKSQNWRDLVDLQTMVVVRHLGMFYGNDWNIRRIKKTLPGFNSIQGNVLSINGKDKKVFTKGRLEEIFKSDIFSKYLDEHYQITLPKGTKIVFSPRDDKNRFSKIRIYKKFFFDVNISFYFSSYMAGLGKVGSYVGLTTPTNKWLVNWGERDKFGTVVVNMVCKANFSKMLPGNPDLLKYKAWINNLFDDLYQTFDWEVCDEEMRRYYEELAALNTVRSLGNAFEQVPVALEPKKLFSKQINAGGPDAKGKSE